MGWRQGAWSAAARCWWTGAGAVRTCPSPCPVRDVVVQGARAEFNGSAGHVGDHVVGAAVGLIIGPDGPVEGVVITVEDCVFKDVVALAGGCFFCQLFYLSFF